MPNETNIPATPLTRLEQYWAGILEKIEGDGNPNYVETIKGTLANPWGDVDIVTLASQCLTNDATVYLLVDGTAIGMPEVELNLQRGGISAGIPFGAVGLHTTGDMIYLNGSIIIFKLSTGAVTTAIIHNDGAITDILPYASNISTTITIIHHPLPDTP